MIEPPPCGAHRRDRVLDAEEDAAQADRLGAVPVLDRDALERPDRAADAGVVEHDVEPAELAQSRARPARRCRPRPRRRCAGTRTGCRFLARASPPLRRPGDVEVGQHHVGALDGRTGSTRRGPCRSPPPVMTATLPFKSYITALHPRRRVPHRTARVRARWLGRRSSLRGPWRRMRSIDRCRHDSDCRSA